MSHTAGGTPVQRLYLQRLNVSILGGLQLHFGVAGGAPVQRLHLQRPNVSN
jgi:hypothetical protein